MKPAAPIALALSVLLAGCSSQPTNETQSGAVAENTVEEVMPSEGAATEEEAMTAAEANAAVGNTAVDPADTAKLERDYLGRWVGVEGMTLTVAAKPGGGVTMDMRWGLDDDMAGTFNGSVTAEGLRFIRNGVAETAVPSDGDATGLKWLAGKKDCLTVKPGEGYCRD